METLLIPLGASPLGNSRCCPHTDSYTWHYRLNQNNFNLTFQEHTNFQYLLCLDRQNNPSAELPWCVSAHRAAGSALYLSLSRRRIESHIKNDSIARHTCDNIETVLIGELLINAAVPVVKYADSYAINNVLNGFSSLLIAKWRNNMLHCPLHFICQCVCVVAFCVCLCVSQVTSNSSLQTLKTLNL